MQAKQARIDEVNAKIRETSATLASERRHLEELQRKAAERKQLRQTIENYRHANEKLRQELLSEDPQMEIRNDVKIGDADAGLEIDMSRLPEDVPGQGPEYTPAQLEYLASLPPTEVILARVRAYIQNNERLKAELKGLQGQSSVLEGQLKRLVSICINVPEDKVDDIIENLVAAVESEREDELDVGRVREFLRKVEGRNED